ncbi:tektin-1 [Xenentodon cancila]
MSFQDHRPHQCGGLNLNNTEAILNHSELFRAECKRLLFDFDKTFKRMQGDEKQQLDQQVRKMQFLKTELELKLEEIVLEIDVLVALHSRVMKALEASKEPLRITNLCLEERMKCPLSERLHDEVDGELLKEKHVIEGVASLLLRVVEQISEQIRLNRSAKYYLEQDLKENCIAQSIDFSLMTGQSISNLQMPKNNAVQPSVAVTPKHWENVSYTNIAKAEQQKTNSVSLRTLVESVLEQTAADMQKQTQVTTAAFQQNVKKMKSAKSQMDDKLPKILAEIISQQRIREDLQVAIKENEHFLSLVQDRLALRHQRPGKERSRDVAQTQLLAEVKQLTAHINRLHEEVVQSEEKQRQLVRCQLKLQESIDTKASCLYVDDVICMQQRDLIIIQQF